MSWISIATFCVRARRYLVREGPNVLALAVFSSLAVALVLTIARWLTTRKSRGEAERMWVDLAKDVATMTAANEAVLEGLSQLGYHNGGVQPELKPRPPDVRRRHLLASAWAWTDSHPHLLSERDAESLSQ